MQDDVGGCGKSQGSGDYFVTRSEAGREQRQVESSGAGIDRHSVFGAGCLLELFLETLRLGAVSQPARTQRVYHFGDVGVVEVRLGDRQEIVWQDALPECVLAARS